MNIKWFGTFTMFLLLFSCKSEYKFILNSPKKIQINESLVLSVSEKHDKLIDSVHFFIDGVKIPSTKNSSTLNISNYKLGKHIVSALLFFESKSEKIENAIYFMADTAPEIYSFKIVKEFPHDSKAYTQGLEFYNGFLYEGTGQTGESSIRKVELNTGKVLQIKNLDNNYFGEGITIFNSKLYQLTWKNGVGFVYNVETFEKEKEFNYKKSREGWGLTHNGKNLLKSDGSEKIWFLNPETLEETTFIEAYTNKQKVEYLNELEYINGKIYANIWQKNSIVIIDEKTGKVEGIADLNNLKKEMEKFQILEPNDEVLNGIAFDSKTNKLYVTGKRWSKLYEIELIKN